MTKKDQKAVRDLFISERECGHFLIDDSEDTAMTDMAEALDIETEYDEEEEELRVPEKYKARVKEALNYYYELHAC